MFCLDCGVEDADYVKDEDDYYGPEEAGEVGVPC